MPCASTLLLPLSPNILEIPFINPKPFTPPSLAAASLPLLPLLDSIALKPQVGQIKSIIIIPRHQGELLIHPNAAVSAI
jgi:hypothetical protein